MKHQYDSKQKIKVSPKSALKFQTHVQVTRNQPGEAEKRVHWSPPHHYERFHHHIGHRVRFHHPTRVIVRNHRIVVLIHLVTKNCWSIPVILQTLELAKYKHIKAIRQRDNQESLLVISDGHH